MGKNKEMNKGKKRISWLLIISMIASLLSPVLSAAEIETGDLAAIIFDVGDGPNTDFPSNQLVGRAGYPISEEGYGASDGYDQNPEFTELERPLLPGSNWAADYWEGYVFDGWYNSEGNKITKMPYTFPYKETTVYTARWKGDNRSSYNLVTEHKANITLVDGSAKMIELCDSTVSSAPAGKTVSTSYRRDISGYIYDDCDSTPKYQAKFGEEAGSGTGREIGTFNGANHHFLGTMPSETVTVTYTYISNTNQKFHFKVQYVDERGNDLAIPDSAKYSAEEPVNASPKMINGYNVKIAEVIEGDTAGDGVYRISDTGGAFKTDNSYVGRMPNQPVTIKYTYEKDPSYEVAVEVVYVDQDGKNLRELGFIDDCIPGLYTGASTDLIKISVPILTGYSDNYNIRWEKLENAVKDSLDSTKVLVTPGIHGGTLTIEYLANLNDKETWSIVSYYSGNHGTISGEVNPQYFQKGRYDIEDLTNQIRAEADSCYIFEGWYLADAQGDKQGEQLTDIHLQGDIRLIAHFVENPTDWFDISFRAGNHGSITNVPVQHIARGTTWNAITIPTATPNPGYRFDDWYDSEGNKVITSDNFQFIADMVYTARFTPIYLDSDYEALNIPDAIGQIMEDGQGGISIAGVAAERKYALTDMSGSILEIQSGVELQNRQGFSGLNPATQYKVYELASSAPAMNVGSSITALDDDLRSIPATVRVLALGANFTISADEHEDGFCKVIISPAASAAEYAVLDEQGSVVCQSHGDEQGWVKAEGVPLAAAFYGLEPDKVYTVVAKQRDEEFSPEDKRDLGSTIYTYLTESEVPYYVIQVINGKIQEVGEAAPETAVYTSASAGDEVRIIADTDPAGREFAGWQILIGEIPGFTSNHVDYYNPRFTMPAGNVVLAATYQADPLATNSNAVLQYSVNPGHEGEVALNLEEDNVQPLLAELLTDEDAAILAEGKSITYHIRYTKRSVTRAELESIRDEEGQYEAALRGAWAIDIALLRYIDGDRRPVGEDCNAGPFATIAQIDLPYWQHLDYQLWEIKDEAVMAIPMSPNPDTEPEYGGLFQFNGEIKGTYILTYSRTYRLQIEDTIRKIPFSAKLRQGDSLENVPEYQDWLPAQTVTDPHGEEWNFIGLSKKAGRYAPYDMNTPITKDTVVYAYYEPFDADWEKAYQELKEKIQEAEDLRNDSSINSKNKEMLKRGIEDALAVLYQTSKPGTEELIRAKENLQAIIDRVKNGDKDSGSKGDAGGGTGQTQTFPKGTVYMAGIDGDWQLIDSEKYQWIFVLRENNQRLCGQWAYIIGSYGKAEGYYYHFAADGIMSSGWFKDEAGSWYYLSEIHDGQFGKMVTGWYFHQEDGKWYYLKPETGRVMAGWQLIDGKWYYFAAEGQNETYQWEESWGKWKYAGGGEDYPWGSMYQREYTPDGYYVNEKGEWEKELKN